MFIYLFIYLFIYFSDHQQAVSLVSLLRNQIRNALKKKAFDEAGLQAAQQQASAAGGAKDQGKLAAQSDVTLNMLNAGESEVDVEEMDHYDGPTEEVSS